MNHRATPPKSKEIFKKKKNKDCYKSSKINIKIIYKLNFQSNIPQFFLLAYTSNFLLPSLCISVDLPTLTHHRQFSFAFCVSNSIIMFFGEVEVGVCEIMDRTAMAVFWVGSYSLGYCRRRLGHGISGGSLVAVNLLLPLLSLCRAFVKQISDLFLI